MDGLVLRSQTFHTGTENIFQNNLCRNHISSPSHNTSPPLAVWFVVSPAEKLDQPVSSFISCFTYPLDDLIFFVPRPTFLPFTIIKIFVPSSSLSRPIMKKSWRNSKGTLLATWVQWFLHLRKFWLGDHEGVKHEIRFKSHIIYWQHMEHIHHRHGLY